MMAKVPPTVCVTHAGAGGGTPSDWEKDKAYKKGLASHQNSQRQVHALLGSFMVNTTLDYSRKTAVNELSCSRNHIAVFVSELVSA